MGNPIEILHRKLKRLKPMLREFNRKYFAELSNKVQEKRKELEFVQVINLNSKTNSDMLQKE
ncbi:hypothetical protein DITRI_Ditri08aG0131600 [Diplodiscus trichospermus]